MENRVGKIEHAWNMPAAAWFGEDKSFLQSSDNYTDPNFSQVIFGRRHVPAATARVHNKIYLFGPCTVTGLFEREDAITIEGRLQEIFNTFGYGYQVVNCGSFGTDDEMFNDVNAMYILMHTALHQGDIVIQMGQRKELFQSAENNSWIQTMTNCDALDQPEYVRQRVFFDGFPAHLLPNGYEAWAKALACRLLPTLPPTDDTAHSRVTPFFRDHVGKRKRRSDLSDWLRQVKENTLADESVGAIVMNANPFTKGHEYLVRYAAEQVDFLYVFVVQEDKSEIPFDLRFQIVTENCKQFPNVKVVPSGKYVLSVFTFSAYFEKDTLQGKSVSPTYDIRLFAEQVAPALGITKRFVGSEPGDTVTQQYNMAMRYILPEFDIDYVEIPRIRLESGEAITATKAREWIKRKDWQACQAYLPEKTIEILKDKL